MKKFFASIVLICFLFALSSCKHPTEPTTHESKPLVANAGIDQTVNVGNYVILDGSQSSGGNGDTLIYTWVALPGNPMKMFPVHDDHPVAYCGFSRQGVYRFTLVVSDRELQSGPDTVTITVNPRTQFVIKEPKLEVHIRWALKKPQGDLTDVDFGSVKDISTYYFAVADSMFSLQGIDRCINLEKLDCGFEKFQDLTPLSTLSKLKFLSLTQDYIVSDLTPLSFLTQLEYLDLFVNNITDVRPIAGLTSMKYVQLMANKVTNMEALANLTSLEELYSSNSTAQNLDFVSNFKNLKTLWMTDGEITDIKGISGLTNLVRLQLENNRIVNISSLADLTNLSLIYLAQNDLVDISSLQYLTNATAITLSGNQIVDLLPLVNNSGLGAGDILTLTALPLSDQSINTYIPALQARGVNIVRLFKK